MDSIVEGTTLAFRIKIVGNKTIINDHGATSAEGIFAGGDCTTSRYKQVVIALGGGATAALGAFDWLIRQQG